MIDDSLTDTSQFELPQDLLRESLRAREPRSDRLHVETWHGSWLSKLMELLVGKD